MTTTNQDKIYSEVTDKIIKVIESGDFGTWIKPWHTLGMPQNAITKKAYRGVNALLTYLSSLENGFNTNQWVTFNQVNELGGCVKKGSKGTPIVFFQPITKGVKISPDDPIDFYKDETLEATTRKVTRILTRYYIVFNLDQTTLDPSEYLPFKMDITGIAEIDSILNRIPAKVEECGDRAFYSLEKDFVRIPPLKTFKSLSDFYATKLHELVHWTGHKSRLSRDFSGRFGNEAYAFEELVAELGSAFMCAYLGISGKLQHTEYISNWLKVLKGDTRAIFSASSLAQKASEYLISFILAL